MATTFEEYWDTVGSREDIADHRERARRAWDAGWEEGRMSAQIDEEIESFRPGWYL